MSGWVMLAQALQDLLVVNETVERSQDEDVQWDVAHFLQLEVSAQILHPTGRLARLLQLKKDLGLLVHVCCQRLQA